jgi:uncharacterized protein YbjT (DUF2867 family)
MDVLVVGGHGKVALRLLGLLAGRGHTGRGIIRDPDQAPELETVGAIPIVLDIEKQEIGEIAGGADAVVFAAGAGPGSGPERKRTVDYGGAVKLIEACKANDVKRYLIVSSIGAHDPASASEEMRPYQEAKADADAEVEKSGLDYTIVRPGMLTDDPGTGNVEINLDFGKRAPVPRDDVALVLAECLEADNTIGKTFELFEGETPAAEAVRAI